MFCVNCGAQFDGNFCPMCGTHAVSRDDSLIEHVPLQPPVQQHSQSTWFHKILRFLKLAVLWYMTAAFMLSGISVIVSDVSIPTGIIWLVSGVFFCPKLLKTIKTSKKVIIAIVLMIIGAFFMPGMPGIV